MQQHRLRPAESSDAIQWPANTPIIQTHYLHYNSHSLHSSP